MHGLPAMQGCLDAGVQTGDGLSILFVGGSFDNRPTCQRHALANRDVDLFVMLDPRIGILDAYFFLWCAGSPSDFSFKWKVRFAA